VKISCVSETVTVIELSPTEMEKYNFNIEKSDYSSPHTRKVLWSIIDEASKITGRNVEVNQGLEIDFLPDIKGGCLLIISQGTPKTKYLLCDKDTGIYESRDINSFLDFAKAATHLKDSAESSFYYYEGCYRLILSSPHKALHILTGEFALTAMDYISTADKTREAFNCLIEANALEILSGLASEQ
jgi:negative regulator of genetic competence, sporulation and motility